MLEKLRNTKQCQAMLSNAEKNDELCLNYQMIYTAVKEALDIELPMMKLVS